MSSIFKKSSNNSISITFSDKEVIQIINLLETSSKIMTTLAESYKQSNDVETAKIYAAKAFSLTSLSDIFIESSDPGSPKGELN